MKVGRIIRVLEEQFPPALALDWDNPGLQVGTMDRSVKKIAVALDATNEVIKDCIDWKADLLVTHHPLLMSGIRQVNSTSMYGRKILALAEHGIAHYAMHTNYDVAEMGRLAERALKLEKCEPLETTGVSEDGAAYGIGRIGDLPKKMTARECCDFVKKAFGLPDVRLFGAEGTVVKHVAVCPGSGKSMIKDALAGKAHLLVTGDIGHHDGLDAVDQGLVIIDAGHYGVEQMFIPQVAALLEKKFPDLKIKAIKTGAPFQTI